MIADLARTTKASTTGPGPTTKRAPAAKASPASTLPTTAEASATSRTATSSRPGADARGTVVAAIKNLGKHGPYLLTSSSHDPARPDTCKAVSLTRYHSTLHSTDGSVSQFIKIGSKEWFKVDSDPWELNAHLDLTGVGCDIPLELGPRDGTEKSAPGAAVRQITGTAVVMGTVADYSARVDKAGRLMRYDIGTGKEQLIYDVTYDRSITVRPPI